MGHSSFTSKLVLKDMLNEDRVNGLFRVILNILFVTLFIEGVGAYLIYLDIKGGLPGGTQEEVFYAVFHAVSAFCNAGISTLSGNMYDPLVAQKYNLHVWIALLIVFGGLGFPIVFNYLKLLRHLLVNTFKIVIGQQKHYIHTPRIININTYIVMISTLVLLAGGTFSTICWKWTIRSPDCRSEDSLPMHSWEPSPRVRPDSALRIWGR